jgi:hypothetical protein
VREIYAKAGERVVCATNGHAICIVAEDIYQGEWPSADKLKDWTQPQPQRKATYAKCWQCQGHWFHAGKPPKLHFEDGWR